MLPDGNPLRVIVSGRGGRMSGQVIGILDTTPGVELAQIVGKNDPIDRLKTDVDVIIDFTAPEATVEYAGWCVENGIPMVTGTTGLGDAERRVLADAGQHVAIVDAPNMSIGVNVLCDLLYRAVRALGPEYEVEITDIHHHHKKDAPSGTAKRLAGVVADARGRDLDEVVNHGREGKSPGRAQEEVGIHAIRGGDVVGDHTVFLFGPGERLEFTHRASDRAIFARGAVRAARWVAHQPPGLYSMADVVATGKESA